MTLDREAFARLMYTHYKTQSELKTNSSKINEMEREEYIKTFRSMYDELTSDGYYIGRIGYSIGGIRLT